VSAVIQFAKLESGSGLIDNTGLTNMDWLSYVVLTIEGVVIKLGVAPEGVVVWTEGFGWLDSLWDVVTFVGRVAC